MSNLKEIRKQKGWSQAKLSEESGVSLRLIQAYEQGYRNINEAQVLTVYQLAKALECDICSLLNI